MNSNRTLTVAIATSFGERRDVNPPIVTGGEHGGAQQHECSAHQSHFPSLIFKEQKVADRLHEGVIRCLCRLEILKSVVLPLTGFLHWSGNHQGINMPLLA